MKKKLEFQCQVLTRYCGAGGVGGLLGVRHIEGATETLSSPAYDSNGNVRAYIGTGTSDQILARYEYGPFGELLRDGGSVAGDDEPHLFSTKLRDPATGHYYYGHRHYAPNTGRWLSRDPIEEEGGLNLYGFVGNDGVNRIDALGLQEVTVTTDFPNPESIAPEVIRIGGSATSYSNKEFSCECTCPDKKNWLISCTASFTAKIRVSTAEARIRGGVSLAKCF